MSILLEVDKQDLNRAIRMLERAGANLEKAVPRIISDTTTLAYRRAREIIEQENIRQTGLYSKSVKMDVQERGKETEGIVGNAAKDARTGFPYPVVLELGSRPHEITPTVARCLHFYTKSGKEVFTTRVRHPGTKPLKVFGRARDFAVKEIPKLVEGALRKMGRL